MWDHNNELTPVICLANRTCHIHFRIPPKFFARFFQVHFSSTFFYSRFFTNPPQQICHSIPDKKKIPPRSHQRFSHHINVLEFEHLLEIIIRICLKYANFLTSLDMGGQPSPLLLKIALKHYSTSIPSD